MFLTCRRKIVFLLYVFKMLLVPVSGIYFRVNRERYHSILVDVMFLQNRVPNDKYLTLNLGEVGSLCS